MLDWEHWQKISNMAAIQPSLTWSGEFRNELADSHAKIGCMERITDPSLKIQRIKANSTYFDSDTSCRMVERNVPALYSVGSSLYWKGSSHDQVPMMLGARRAWTEALLSQSVSSSLKNSLVSDFSHSNCSSLFNDGKDENLGFSTSESVESLEYFLPTAINSSNSLRNPDPLLYSSNARTSCKRSSREEQSSSKSSHSYFNVDRADSSAIGPDFSLITDNPRNSKKPKMETHAKQLEINFGQPNSSWASVEELDAEEMAQMKEMIYRAAAFRPVNLGLEVIERPKRKNVRISSDPQTTAARQRRERISERIRVLQKLVPGGNKLDIASMLDEAANYLKFLKSQVHSLEKTSHRLHSMNCTATTTLPLNTYAFPLHSSLP